MTFETGMIIILIIGFFMCFKNIIYGEALMAIYLLATDLSEKTKLHEVYCLMIAAIVAIIFCVIMYKIKVLRYVLSLGDIHCVCVDDMDRCTRKDGQYLEHILDNIIICDNDWTACDGI